MHARIFPQSVGALALAISKINEILRSLSENTYIFYFWGSNYADWPPRNPGYIYSRRITTAARQWLRIAGEKSPGSENPKNEARFSDKGKFNRLTWFRARAFPALRLSLPLALGHHVHARIRPATSTRARLHSVFSCPPFFAPHLKVKYAQFFSHLSGFVCILSPRGNFLPHSMSREMTSLISDRICIDFYIFFKYLFFSLFHKSWAN